MKRIAILLVLSSIVFNKWAFSQEAVDAINSHDAVRVKTLLASGADVNQKDKNGNPLIVLASASGDSSIVSLLIEHKAKINVTGDQMLTPLMEASAGGYPQIVNMLLTAGADVNDVEKVAIAENELRDRTALMLAAENGYAEIVKILIDHNADVNKQGRIYIDVGRKKNDRSVETKMEGYKFRGPVTDIHEMKAETALILAIEQKHCDVATILMRNKADIERQDEKIILLKSASLPTHIVGDETPLLVAARVGDSCSTRALVEANADIKIENAEGLSPLAEASLHGHAGIVDFLIKHGADMKHKMGEFALPIISYGILSNNFDVVKLLLNNGANVNDVTGDNASPLLIAVDKMNLAIINLLLTLKADPNIANDNGLTPLILASKKGCSECVRTLLASGALTDTEDKNSYTALTYAKNANYQEIVDMLTKAGAKK